jgi:ribosomal subunit interface protein
MEHVPEITFRNMNRTDWVEDEVRQKIEKLEQFHDRIERCHVVIEVPHRQHRKGEHYVVRIDLRVPGGEIVVNRDPTEHESYTDVRVAIRDAFSAAQRQLQDFRRRQQGQIKTHAPTPRPTGTQM